MTPFKENITNSIDNINKSKENLDKLNAVFKDVYVDAPNKIDDILENNIDEKSGTSLQFTNTVENGKLDWKLKGDTFQQTYTGKNLFNVNAIENISTATIKITITNNTIVISDNASQNGYAATGKKISELAPNLKVDDVAFLTFDTTSQVGTPNRIYLTSPASTVWNKNTSKTITQNMLDSNVVFYGGTDETAVISNIQIEIGETATSYEPYVGGIPAPNPDYPQDIKVVTGENTITIANEDNTESESYTVNLGTTELCKIGDYQDYIYGVKDNWKLVKIINKVELSDLTGWTRTQKTSTTLFTNVNVNVNDKTGEIKVISDYFYPRTPVDIFENEKLGITSRRGANYGIAISVNGSVTTDTFTTFITTNNPIIYFVLDNATTTDIEDDDLISDLNDLYDATVYEDETNITATASGTNLPIILDVKAFVTEKEE